MERHFNDEKHIQKDFQLSFDKILHNFVQNS